MDSLVCVLSVPVAVSGFNYVSGSQRLSLFVASFVNFGRLGLPVAATASAAMVSGQRLRSEVVTFAENGENLVQHWRLLLRNGFPVIDDDLKLVGVVSDYDLLAPDSISGATPTESNSLFPDVDSSWKTFNEIQKLLSTTNGRTLGDVMTSDPLVVRETTNLEDTARLGLLQGEASYELHFKLKKRMKISILSLANLGNIPEASRNRTLATGLLASDNYLSIAVRHIALRCRVY